MKTKSFLILLFSLSTTLTLAQTWSPVVNGVNSYVWGMITDNTTNKLYFCGAFSDDGVTVFNRVASWDGTSFAALNTGVNDFAYAFALYNGSVHCAGKFTAAGSNSCNRIARWDGSDWQPLGSGMDNEIFYLCTYNGELYAGGVFLNAGGTAASLIAKWDGTTWDSVGTGIANTGSPAILSMAEYNGELYVAGGFTDAGGVSVNNIAKWNGTTWSDVGGGLTGSGPFVTDLYVYNGALYATGNFTDAGGTLCSGIAKWDGITWSSPGAGFGNGYGTVLFSYGGELYVGGTFLSVDGVSANRIARYNGTTWNDLDQGCNDEVDALEVFDGDLIVGGIFGQAGGITANNIAKWNVPCTVTATSSVLSQTCTGTCNGSASVIASGVAPLSVLWSNSATTDSISGLCSGTYYVTVTDSVGCIATDSVEIIDLALPQPSVTASNPTCPVSCDGSAIVTASGNAPFVYSWNTNPVQTGDTASSLCSGTYIVTITDSAGCVAEDSITLNDPIYQLSFTSVDPACSQICNGSATVNYTSPHAPYSYSWNTVPVQTGQTATNLCEGIFIVTVTDSNNCATIDSVQLINPAPFVLSFSSSSESCPLACDGMAAVTTNSPYSPYSYFWSTVPQQNTDTAFNLCPGNYTVTLIDSVGCFSTDSITIDPSPKFLSFNTTPISCIPGCDGSITVIPTATAPFFYSWSTGDTTDVITGLCPSTYLIQVTDSDGCVMNESITLDPPSNPTINFTTTPVLCDGICDGSIVANVTGNGTINYLWSTTDTTGSLSNLCPGWYVLTVTDDLGCTSTDSTLLFPPFPLSVFTTNTQDVSCNGLCDGFISVTASGGAFPYQYLWNTGDTNNALFSICAGTYTVTVTDNNGCTDISTPIIINEPAALTLQMNVTNASCQGCNDGSITTLVGGGTAPYIYFWTPPVPDPNQLTAGWYYLCITDNNGCQICDSAFVDEPNGFVDVFSIVYEPFIIPNPFTESAVISLPVSVSGELLFSVFDIAGKNMAGLSYSLKKRKSQTEIVLLRGNLDAGMYFFEISAKGIRATGKLVIQ